MFGNISIKETSMESRLLGILLETMNRGLPTADFSLVTQMHQLME